MADNNLWHWLRFLRAESREDLEMIAGASPELKRTVVKLLELSEDEESRLIYEAEVKAQRDERARMHGAYEKGVAEGEHKGRLVGMAEGKNEKALEIARNLLAIGMPIEKIVGVTALSCSDIEKLRTD